MTYSIIEIGQPCLTPLVTRKKGVKWPLILTLLLISLYNNLIQEMNILPKLNLLNTFFEVNLVCSFVNAFWRK